MALLAACKPGASDASDGGSILWMEGFAYEWEFFNHRVSHLEFVANDEGGLASVIGGTSTTGVNPELPATCDPDLCDEVPFVDNAEVTVNWARVEAATARFVTVDVDLAVGADGAMTAVEVQLPVGADASGEVSAVLRGIRVSTDRALSGGDACYNPEYGWLPTSLGFEIGVPELAGETVSFDVSANFTAGNTLESFRECIDAVVEQAVVDMHLEVLVSVGGGRVAEQTLTAAETYAYGDGPTNPEPQPLPEQTTLDLGLDSPLVGWRSASWNFHIDDPDGRGAYLRRVELLATGQRARGAATNYSPVTQQSGFDYSFEGVVVGHEIGGEITRGTVEATFPVELNSDGQPVTHPLGLGG